MGCSWQGDGEPRLHRIGVVAATTLLLIFIILSADIVLAQQNAASSSGSQISKALGRIKSIRRIRFRVPARFGAEAPRQKPSTPKILRVPRGEKDLRMRPP